MSLPIGKGGDMNRAQEIMLLEELVGLKQTGRLYLDDQPTTNPVGDYTQPDRFALEQARIFERQPMITAHRSELEGAHSFLRRTVNGMRPPSARKRSVPSALITGVCS